MDTSYNELSTNLRDNNPYVNGRILQFEDGSAELERDFPVYAGSESDNYYTVMINDTIDRIAWSQYKDFVDDAAKYWWVICDANQIENPLDLSDYIGQEIIIPNVLNFKLLYNS